ncbi:MAG: histidine phosphatase family protein [Chitinophagaceae bacterium]|nr:MAG: putative phosphohistidine phosphatase, SixA [Bacteroidetes bacterium OLB11]MCC6448137.1 histidine phosphatase family protein [Chitinophagaceae bacterium]HMN33509.1 histidine phosphatase family protein [Chitinophagaceae bacterium]
MKNLYLLRHADAEYASPSQPDMNRALSQQGIKEAQWMGHIIQKKINIDAILSSTAQRAKETSEIVSNIISYDIHSILWDKELYLAKPEIIESKIIKIESSIQSLLVVCHNPGLSYFASSLNISSPYLLPTCGLVSFKIDITSWEDFPFAFKEFVSFEYPHS